MIQSHENMLLIICEFEQALQNMFAIFFLLFFFSENRISKKLSYVSIEQLVLIFSDEFNFFR